MQEELLHYIWKYRKFDFSRAKTTAGEELVILDPGIHNQNSGPDFFNARLKIGGQIWAGNVEVHIKASDWYFHGHETDKNYDNVVLHVVWEEDVDVFRRNNSAIPALALKSFVSPAILSNYKSLISGEKWINCENDFAGFSDFEISHWLERIFFERLEEKSVRISEMLRKTGNDWEAVLFRLLARNFGLNVNGDAFESLAENTPFKLVQKLKNDLPGLEALFLGQAGFLAKKQESAYFEKLLEKYQFLKHKYQLHREGVIPPKYFRLRPDNFPNIRLAQLAAVYHKNSNLFAEVISAANAEEFFSLLDIQVSDYWESHYTFGKEHQPRSKNLSRNFKDLILINSIIPLKFAYAKFIGKEIEEELLEMMQSLQPERNSVIEKFESLKSESVRNALDSQALLQLKKNYCEKNLCLQCALGNRLLQQNVE